MHYLPHTRLRPSPNEREGRSSTGSSPCCVGARCRRVPNDSRRIGTAWHLRTTENFTVPLHKLYKRSFTGHAFHRSAGALHICVVAGMLSHNCPVPSTPPIAHDIK